MLSAICLAFFLSFSEKDMIAIYKVAAHNRKKKDRQIGERLQSRHYYILFDSHFFRLNAIIQSTHFFNAFKV
jgi:hypothetical protein